MRFRRLYESRTEKGLTPKQAGDFLGISEQVYSLHETGRRELTSDMLMALTALYGVSADYLAELIDDPTPYPPSKK